MNHTSLPENILRRMKPSDRKAMGLLTSEEAGAKCVAKSEKELQQQISGLLDLRGIPYARQRMDRRSNVVEGWPDITFALYGQAIAFECKHAGRGLDPEQKKMLPRMLAHGWHCYIVRTFEHARELITNYQNQICYPPGSNITKEDLE